MKYIAALVFSALLLAGSNLLTGCSDDEPKTSVEKPLARVGTEFIYPSELEYQFNKLFSSTAVMADEKVVKQRLKESLVLTKQMAQKAILGMSGHQKQQLDLQVSQYRDEILAKRYINDFLTVEVPTPQEVADYYNKNLHKFGGETHVSMVEFVFDKTCAMDISTQVNYTSEKAVINMLDKANCLYKVQLKEKALTDVSAISRSDSFKEGRFLFLPSAKNLTAVFVKSISKHPAKPLSEVVPVIRKMLAPIYLKKALKKERLAPSQEMEVEFFD